MARNPEVKTLRGNKIDLDRYIGASTELITAFFMLPIMPAIKWIKRENRYNMDEEGIIEGVGLISLVLGSS
jgi:endoglucanase Acf2